MLSKSELFGVVLPSNISPGVFVQVAGDNNDNNEETLFGKGTTHATTLALYQRGQFGLTPKPRVCTGQTNRKRSLQSTGESIRQCVRKTACCYQFLREDICRVVQMHLLGHW